MVKSRPSFSSRWKDPQHLPKSHQMITRIFECNIISPFILKDRCKIHPLYFFEIFSKKHSHLLYFWGVTNQKHRKHHLFFLQIPLKQEKLLPPPLPTHGTLPPLHWKPFPGCPDPHQGSGFQLWTHWPRPRGNLDFFLMHLERWRGRLNQRFSMWKEHMDGRKIKKPLRLFKAIFVLFT